MGICIKIQIIIRVEGIFNGKFFKNPFILSQFLDRQIQQIQQLCRPLKNKNKKAKKLTMDVLQWPVEARALQQTSFPCCIFLQR